MIRLESVTFSYVPGQPVFEEFSWQAARGDAWAVIGSSGCGKSTLLALLAGLRLPDSGRVLIDGEPLVRPRPHSGLIIQDYGLLPWATVRENAGLGLRVRRFYGPDGTHAPKERIPKEYNPKGPVSKDGLSSAGVDYWLERLGLVQVAGAYPGQISGGQRQRAAIARTLALQPDLLLMDEPFSSLDAPTRESLQALTLDLWEEHQLTMVIVTHAIEEAAVLGRRILLFGRPPVRGGLVIENPGWGQPGFRDSAGYLALCRQLRGLLEVS